jgi:hypothetical protein
MNIGDGRGAKDRFQNQYRQNLTNLVCDQIAVKLGENPEAYLPEFFTAFRPE